MTYSEALEFIHRVGNVFCKPGLERITHLCEALGHPERSLKFIHIGGTNGKGSFCSMLDSVLRAAGYKVGLYTSPYIVAFNERMRVGGENIPNDTLCEIVRLVQPIAEAMEDKPTEFEIITAVAFEYFRRERVDVVILEVGLGGRLDSTNIIRNPILSVITGISLDHTAILGDTVEKIATEKAGIIKDGTPVLYGGTDETAYEVIKGVADGRGSMLYRTDYLALSVKSATLEGTVFDFGEWRDISLNLLGMYQPRNAASVLTAVDMLKSYGMDIPEAAVRSGLLSARWPARFELLSREPVVIYDGAHNPEGISGAVASIKRYFNEKVYILTGVLKDKDYNFIARELAEVAERAFTITPDNPRALSACDYAEVLRGLGGRAEAYSNITDAVSAAYKAARADGVPLICLGSLYTYGDVTRALQFEKER